MLDILARAPAGATLSDTQRSATCRVNRNWLAEYGFSEAKLEVERAAFQKSGYALNRGQVVPGMSAVSIPVLTANGRLAAAIAIAAITERMGRKRIEKILLPALRREAAVLADRLNQFEKEYAE